MPDELEKAVSHTHTERKEFIEGHCVLFAELFPLEERTDGIVVFNGLLPKTIASRMKEKLGSVPDFFLALPFIAFDRGQEACTFLSGEALCSIYEARPKQCELFPNLSLDKDKPTCEQYSFCNLAGQSLPELDEEHLKATKDYFTSVEASGFANVWHSLPEKAIVRIKGMEFPVSKEDFLGLLGPYA